MLGIVPASPIESTAHIIQTALTPVFLLSGIASLLGVFAGRLARVADRGHQLTAALETASNPARGRLEAELGFLHVRSRLLDGAVLLGTAAGGSTCLAALLLFVSSLRDAIIAGLLYVSFGLALICTAGALAAFMAEVLMASRGMRDRQRAAVHRNQRRGGASPPAG